MVSLSLSQGGSGHLIEHCKEDILGKDSEVSIGLVMSRSLLGEDDILEYLLDKRSEYIIPGK